MTAAAGFTMKELAEERLATTSPPSLLTTGEVKFTPEHRKLVLDTCCGGASEKEANELVAIAEARGMDPIRGECYFVKRWDSQKQRYVWAVQASIDAFRIKAEETGLYAGQDEPEYEYEADGKLKLARVRVWRKDWPRPVVGVARYSEYVQTDKDGKPTRFWKQMPHNQLAKCAEALAMRKAFPARFARIYTPDEMAQADNDAPNERVTADGEIVDQPKPSAARASKPRAKAEDSPSTDLLIKASVDALLAAESLLALKTAWDPLPPNVKRLSEVASAKERRKDEIVARQRGESPSPPSTATSSPPTSSSTTPAPPAVPCFYCKEPVGPDAIEFEGPGGVIERKHQGCTAFGKGREPGEEG